MFRFSQMAKVKGIKCLTAGHQVNGAWRVALKYAMVKADWKESWGKFVRINVVTTYLASLVS